MLKKLLAIAMALFMASAFAASVDANKATQAELETVKGIGPAISAKIIDERKKGPFKDWQDLVDRVKGVGETSAAKLSAGGLTVNGSAFAGAPAAAPAPKAEKASKKTEAAKADTAAPAAPAAPADEAKAAKAPKAKKEKAAKAAKADEPASAPAAKDKKSKKKADKADDAASKPAAKK